MDWKEALANLKPSVDSKADKFDIMPSAPEESDKKETVSSGKKQQGKLHISLEKKGRGGKTATIIYGFEIAEEEILDLAGLLKHRLGVGGSARGGEILLQGDCREKIIPILKEQGFRC